MALLVDKKIQLPQKKKKKKKMLSDLGFLCPQMQEGYILMSGLIFLLNTRPPDKPISEDLSRRSI